MHDRDYLALVSIEKRLRNEISSLSMSGNQFLEFVMAMETSRMGINGALKALCMLEDLDARTGKTQSLEGCGYWIDALAKGTLDPSWSELFVNIDYDQPLAPEFAPIAQEAARTLHHPHLRDWLTLLAVALILSALMAVLVLVLSLNFWLVALLALLIYGLFSWWYFSSEIPRQHLRHLKAARRTTKGQIRRFLNHIQLASSENASRTDAK